MAFFIRDIRNTSVTAGKKYLLDTNVWLFLLDAGPNPKAYISPYLHFFQEISKSASSPRPKIILTSLVLAETINRHLRDVTFKTYCAKYGIDIAARTYKENYRNSNAFLSDYTNVCEDIKAYHNFTELVQDGFGTALTLKKLLKNPIPKLDFNDQYYYLLAKEHGYSIVTHDCDFYVEGVEVITANAQLLKQAK